MNNSSKDFLNKVLVETIDNLIKNENYFALIIVLSQSIETLGAFLDKKPFRAKNQSKIRFNTALKMLFSKKYFFLNKDYYLYNQLRNHTTHSLIPSTSINFYIKGEFKHLSVSESVLNISLIQFAEDTKSAISKLNSLIEEGEITEKKIPYNDELFINHHFQDKS